MKNYIRCSICEKPVRKGNSCVIIRDYIDDSVIHVVCKDCASQLEILTAEDLDSYLDCEDEDDDEFE